MKVILHSVGPISSEKIPSREIFVGLRFDGFETITSYNTQE